MCTLVETPDIKVLLDAGVSLSPYRFGLPPHPTEFCAISNLRKKIAAAAEAVDIVTISHYHFDHHTPGYEDWIVNWTEPKETARQIYQDKIIFLKNPREKVNPSQRRRAWIFEKTVGKLAKRLQSVDSSVLRFGGQTLFRFSEPVVHGSDDAVLGWVIMVEVEFGGDRFMFAPDVQGPMSCQTLSLIEKARPQLLMVGGPPFYLSSLKVSESQLGRAVANLVRIVEFVPMIILEHHILRDSLWRDRAKPIFSAAAKFGHRVVTAAEFCGQENCLLESRRKELYSESPPSREFERWMKLDCRKKRVPKPPI